MRAAGQIIPALIIHMGLPKNPITHIWFLKGRNGWNRRDCVKRRNSLDKRNGADRKCCVESKQKP